MLKLQFRDRRRESVWLVDENFTVGKASSNSLVIDDDSVLDQHITITNASEHVTVTNTSNSSKVLLNGKPVARKAQLKANDVLTLGSVELELIDPKAISEQSGAIKTTNFSQGWSIYSSASWLDQNRFMLEKKMIIGRDPSSDIVLPLDHLSRKHVSLEVKNGRLFLEDLDSSNGTFVNGKQVSKIELKTGDKIKLDVVTFEVNGPAAAHDPNKTIIRSAPESPANKKAPQSRLATKIESFEPAKQGGKRPSKKRLASDGKQDWISKEAEQELEQSSDNKNLVIGLCVIVISLAIASTIIIL